jgi:hypothetical protein
VADRPRSRGWGLTPAGRVLLVLFAIAIPAAIFGSRGVQEAAVTIAALLLAATLADAAFGAERLSMPKPSDSGAVDPTGNPVPSSREFVRPPDDGELL